MWEKLKQLARRYDEIGELLEVPEIYADPKKLRALTREQKELSAVVETYRAYQKCEDDIVQALELVSDPELKDIAQEELNTAKAEKERLFDELRVLLLPRTRTTTKTSSSRSAAAWAGRRARFLPPTSTACMRCTRKSGGTAWSCSTTTTRSSAA